MSMDADDPTIGPPAPERSEWAQSPSSAVPAERGAMKMSTYGGITITRRNQMLDWTPEEHAIHNVLQLIEAMGAHPRLTDAVILLGQAKDAVSDFVDALPEPAPAFALGQEWVSRATSADAPDSPSVIGVPAERGAGGPEQHKWTTRGDSPSATQDVWSGCSCGEPFWFRVDQEAHALTSLRAALSAATEQIKTLESLNILKVLEQDESAAITENLLLHDQLADAQGDTQRLDAIEKGTHGLCHRRSAVTGVSSWEVWWGRHGNFMHATSLRAAIDAAMLSESPR